MPLDTISDTDTRSFEDSLRALGALIDRRKLHGLGLELDRRGVTLAARHGPIEQPEVVALRLTDTQLATLCRDARRRRGTGTAPVGHQRPSRLATLRARQATPAPLSQWVEQTQRPSYQEVLRIIGRDLDRWQARSCRIEEEEADFIVRVLSAGSRGGVQQVYRFDKEILRARVAEAIRRRRHHQPTRRLGTGELVSPA